VALETQSGSLLLYRVFDVGEEINLRAVEDILKAERGEKRVRISPSRPEALIVKDAPIRVVLGSEQLTLAGKPHPCEVTATIYSYAAISIRFQVSLAGVSWDEIQQISRTLSEAPASMPEVEKAAVRCRDLARTIERSIQKPGISQIVEDYAIFLFEKLAGISSARDFMDKVDLPALMLGETREQLSQRARDHALEGLFQYAEHDLTLIGWDTAVFEASGGTDVADVIEFALTHLLEFRVYDDLLDQRLGEVYDAVEVGRQKILRSPFEKIVAEVNTRYIEFSEFTDRIDNSLKVVGDYYLATIFRGAARRFRIPDWQRNMRVLADVSNLLQGELNARMSHLLELVVIILILFEIAMAFVRRGR